MIDYIFHLFHLFRRTDKHTASRPGARNRQRLSVEALEDRCLPSALPAPSLTATPASTSQINLSWTPITGATSYPVREVVNGQWATIKTETSPTTSFSVTGLGAGTTYIFDVGAADAGGASFSVAVPAGTLPAAPAAPTFTATAVGTSQVYITWSAVSGATRYQVQEEISNRYKTIDTVGAVSTSVVVTGLNAGTSYTFNVVAVNSGGATYGTPQALTTLPVAPAAPSSVHAKGVSPSSVTVSWKTVTGAASYDIEQLSSNGAWMQIGTANTYATAYAVNGLSADTIYDFDVVAVNAGGATWGIQYVTRTLAASATPLSSPNWSGYVIQPTDPVTAVGGTWVVPTMPSAKTGAVSIWVGIDGYNGTVEQLGTEWTATGGYRAWIEYYGDPQPLHTTPLPEIQPGDTVSAEIAYVSTTGNNSTFQLAFSVLTPTGHTESWSAQLATSDIFAQLASGEWIVEAPGYGHKDFGPLANFGSVQFTEAWATAGTTTGGINSFTNYAINMDTTGHGGGKADPSGLTASSSSGFQEPSGGGSSAFTDTFEGANPAASRKARSSTV